MSAVVSPKGENSLAGFSTGEKSRKGFLFVSNIKSSSDWFSTSGSYPGVLLEGESFPNESMVALKLGCVLASNEVSSYSVELEVRAC